MKLHDVPLMYSPAGYRTEALYMAEDTPIREMSHADLHKGMCPRCRGKLTVCINECQAPCAYGKELMRRCGQL